MTDNTPTWFRDTPRSRRLIEAERRKVQKLEDDYEATLVCACGAPAALSVVYRGEIAPVDQCVRCATADPRAPFFHRKLNSTLEWP